jgi:hypothetical protein
MAAALRPHLKNKRAKEMKTQTFNIRYVLLQRSEAGFSQLKARRQSCHYLVTKEGRLLTVHELTPEDGVIVIVVAGCGNSAFDGLTAKQFNAAGEVISLIACLCPDAKVIHEGNKAARIASAA